MKWICGIQVNNLITVMCNNANTNLSYACMGQMMTPRRTLDLKQKTGLIRNVSYNIEIQNV